MITIKRCLLSLMVLVVCLLAPVPAGADGGTPPAADMGIIPASRVRPDGYTPKYDQYGVERYAWDHDLGFTAVGDKTWTSVANFLMLLTAVIVKIGIRAMEWAFTMPLVDALLVHLQRALDALAASLWNSYLIQFGVVAAGVYAAWVGMVLRQTSRAVGALISAVLVITAAAWSFGGGLVWALGFTNDATTELSSAVLAAVSGTVDGKGGSTQWAGSKAFVAGGEGIWDTFVVVPWAAGAFNGTNEAPAKYQADGVAGGQLLQKNAQERIDFYNVHKKTDAGDFTWWTDGNASGRRLVIGGLALVVALLFTLIILACSGAVLVFQVVAVLLLTMAPIVFVVALIWPGAGAWLLSKWASKVLGFLFSKVAVATVLALVIVEAVILYQVGSAWGWAAGAFLQIVLVAAVVLNAKSLWGAVAALPHAPERAMQHLSTWTGPRVAGGIAGLAGRARGRVAEWKEHRQADASLNQRLGMDRKKAKEAAARGGQVQTTDLMRKAEERTQRGARRLWTTAELKGEAARNRQLRELGADPLAIPATGTEGEYRSQVGAVRAENADVQRRLAEMRRVYQPRVRQQVWERSLPGRIANVLPHRKRPAAQAGGTRTGIGAPQPPSTASLQRRPGLFSREPQSYPTTPTLLVDSPPKPKKERKPRQGQGETPGKQVRPRPASRAKTPASGTQMDSKPRPARSPAPAQTAPRLQAAPELTGATSAPLGGSSATKAPVKPPASTQPTRVRLTGPQATGLRQRAKLSRPPRGNRK